jgi:hypothetical protein
MYEARYTTDAAAKSVQSPLSAATATVAAAPVYAVTRDTIPIRYAVGMLTATVKNPFVQPSQRLLGLSGYMRKTTACPPVKSLKRIWFRAKYLPIPRSSINSFLTRPCPPALFSAPVRQAIVFPIQPSGFLSIGITLAPSDQAVSPHESVDLLSTQMTSRG